MIDGLKQYLHTFMLSTKGSIAIMFVLMIPMLFVFMAYYFDSVQLVAKQARLSDAVDEGTLAISSRGWGDDKHKENIDTVKRYLTSYLPEAKSFRDIEVKLHDPANSCMTRYYVTAKAEINMAFHYNKFPSFDSTEFVSANSKACLRSSKMSFVGDFAFLIDLSSSMRCNMRPGSRCGDENGISNDAKIEKLKDVVTNMIVEIMGSSEKSKFALVPFNVGVPIKLNGKNERGGALIGCTVAFTPKPEFDIDYAYWANKYIPPEARTLDEAVSFVDNARFEYYDSYVVDNVSELDHYCTQNDPNNVEENKGQASRSCMSNINYTYVNAPKVGSQEWYNNNTMLYHDASFANIYQCTDSSAIWSSCVESLITPYISRRLHPTFVKEWEKARDARQIAAKLDPAPGGSAEYHDRMLLYRNIVNDESIDYEKTLQNMFDQSSVRTFAMPWVYRHNHFDDNPTKRLRPYHWMCPSIEGGDLGFDNDEPADRGKEVMKRTMHTADITHSLIELTRFCGRNKFTEEDLGSCDSSKVDLKEIENISVGRGVRTDTITGLLRAIPIVANSENNFKSIIIVSDGADNINLTLSTKMLNNYKICDRIREGFKKLNKDNEVGLYMIFTYTPSPGEGDEIDKHVALWKNCVGDDNFYYASTVAKLQAAIKDILSKTNNKQDSEMATFIPDDNV